MRDLKFRLWSKRTNRYITTCIVDGVEYNEISAFDLFGLRSDAQFQSDVIIEQYTGLKDKNGKEIYEGDIVASITKSIEGVKPSFCSYLKGVVKYCEEDTRYYIDGSCERSDREILEKVDLTDVDNFVGNYYELEVIGNIHENPELVRDEE